MNTQIRDHVTAGAVCATYKPEQSKRPVRPHKMLSRPWSKVGVDLCMLDKCELRHNCRLLLQFLRGRPLKDTLATTGCLQDEVPLRKAWDTGNCHERQRPDRISSGMTSLRLPKNGNANISLRCRDISNRMARRRTQ